MRTKVINYVYNCWYWVKCHKKEDIERIVDEIILENPDVKNTTKLGMLAKRRCQNELN